MGSKKIEKGNGEAGACSLAGSMAHLLVALDKRFGFYRELSEAYREADPENSKAYFHKAKATSESAALLGSLLEAYGVVELKREETPEERLLRSIFGKGKPREGRSKGKAPAPAKAAGCAEGGDDDGSKEN